MFNNYYLEILLQAKGWTKYRLAKEANLGQSTIHEIVSGKKKEPKVATLEKIADALQIPIVYLLNETLILDAIEEIKLKNDVHKNNVQIVPIQEESNDWIQSLVEALTESNKAKNSYKEEIQKLKDNGMVKLTESDTQLISKIIEILAVEKNLTISDAQEILSKASMLLPMITKLSEGRRIESD